MSTSVPPPSPPTTPASPEAPAQASMSSLPHAALSSINVQKEVDAIMQRVGLGRGADGGLLVQDSASVGKSPEVADLKRFEQVYGTSESQLKPPGPPKIDFNENRRVGAESFAANMDRVIDDILMRPKTQQPIHPQDLKADKSEPAPVRPDGPVGIDTGATPEGPTRKDTPNHSQMRDQGNQGQAMPSQSTEGIDQPAPGMLARLRGSQGAELDMPQRAGPSPEKTKSIWMLGQEIYSSPEAVQVRASVAATALQPTAATDNQMMFRRLSELSADVLLAAFLKLNITDPNNSVETHQNLHTAMSELRQRAIRDAQQKMKVAAKLRAEAEKEADKASYVSSLMSVIRIVLCVAALICMCIPCLQGIALLVIMIVIALACCACTVVEAKANNDAANASIDAGQAGLMGKRAQMMAEQMQEQLEQEAEIMEMIMESKNKMVEAVIRMMNAAFGSAQKLMSAGMARG